MANSRLEIDGVNAGYNNLLNISTNYSIADIYEPDKRNSSYTKSISIPSTKEINQVFEFTFDINILTNSFNPNIKVAAKYYVNEILIFDGYIRLLSIKKNYEQGQFNGCAYECALIGNNGNFFLEIYNRYLTDIDFSDLDHAFAYSSGKVIPSTPGVGYFYPNIDYGLGRYGKVSGAPSSTIWFDDLKPAIWEYEYINRIFDDAGFTFTSSFLGNASYEKNIFIPCNTLGKLQLSQTDLLDSQIYVGRTSNTSTNYGGTYIGGAGVYWDHNPNQVIALNVDSGSYSDPGANYDTATYIFTQPITGYYTFNTIFNYTLTLTHTPAAATTTGYADIQLIIQYDSGSGWTTALSSTISPTLAGAVTTGSHSLNVPSTLTQAGTQWRVSVFSHVYANYKDGGGVNITTGSSSLAFQTNSASDLVALLAVSELQYNNTVTMNDLIPADVRQIDFITSIIKLENLYMDIDKENPTNYLIEPREDFIDETTYVDWTGKLDTSKEILINPMGELDFKRYTFKYKEDADHLNESYQNKYKEPYGTQVVNIENDFNTSEKVTEVIFSNTPLSQEGGVLIVAPRLFTWNGAVKVPMKTNIRRLYYGGQSNTYGSIQYQNPTYTSSGGMYLPFCGHVDNPLTPSWDLSFGTPKEINWILAGQTYTSANRYNVQWSKFITEITDRDSKIVTAYFNLNEYDINSFKFSRLVFCDGTYYLVNKIYDYDPQNEGTTKVEMLKLKKGVTFVSANQPLRGAGGSYVPTITPVNPSGNYGTNSFGSNVINYDDNTFAFGENISIDI